MTETPQPPEENKPAPGYYPDGSGASRYWDGNGWTDQTQGQGATGAPTMTASNPRAEHKAAKAYAKATRPWYKKKRWIIAIVVVIIIIAAAAGSGGGGGGSDTSSEPASSSADPKAATPAPAKKAVKEKKSEPDMTAGQENALKAAGNYLGLTPFSREGLIRQLSSDAGDGYSKADATFAVDNVDANWKEQAAKAAENYLDMTSFSRDGLIEQLTSDAGDQYTLEEATYGVDKAGL